jgi:hypothetical protein
MVYDMCQWPKSRSGFFHAKKKEYENSCSEEEFIALLNLFQEIPEKVETSFGIKNIIKGMNMEWNMRSYLDSFVLGDIYNRHFIKNKRIDNCILMLR